MLYQTTKSALNRGLPEEELNSYLSTQGLYLVAVKKNKTKQKTINYLSSVINKPSLGRHI